jgi:hypothetical protein
MGLFVFFFFFFTMLMLQYMTFPMHSSEKASLVPVLATLLQFTPKELSSVLKAAQMEPVTSSLWSTFTLGGGGGGGVGPGGLGVSSRPVKEVKRPVAPVLSGATATAKNTISSPVVATSGRKTAVSGTASASANGSSAPSTPAFDGKSNNGNDSGNQKHTGIGAILGDIGHSDSTGNLGHYAGSALSPSTSNNSDMEGAAGGAGAAGAVSASSGGNRGYSPPRLHQVVAQQQQQSPHPHNNLNADTNSSLMVESASSSNNGGAGTETMAVTSSSASFISPGGKPNSSGGGGGGGGGGGRGVRPSISRSGSTSSARGGKASSSRALLQMRSKMNSSDYDFQQKLQRIGSDVLSLDNSVSYDDVDMAFVEVEDGIDEEGEGDELDDGEDGTSV